MKEAGLTCELIGTGETVVRQLPMAGSEILSGSKLLLYTEETELPQATVPDVSGLTGTAARKVLEEQGLSLQVQGAYAGDEAALSCFQSIPAGKKIETGTVITVTLREDTDIGLE